MPRSPTRFVSLRLLAVALAATAALISGCSATSTPSVAVAGTVPPSIAAGATPTATAAPTPTPTPSPTPGPSPKALCSTGDGVFPPKTCALAPGTYSAAPFAPVFRFTIGAGWSNTLAGINAGGVVMGKPIATGFGWSTGMVAEDGAVVGKTTDTLLAYFTQVPGISVSAPTPVTVGGMPGRAIDFTLSKGSIFMMVGKSANQYQVGEKVRAIIVDVNGAVVLLGIEAFNIKGFDAALAATQPILDSIVWN
jgi:hypothetical protein